MNTTSSCLSTDELRELLGGLAAGPQQELCTQHLDQCACCQAKLEELAKQRLPLADLTTAAVREVVNRRHDCHTELLPLPLSPLTFLQIAFRQ